MNSIAPYRRFFSLGKTPQTYKSNVLSSLFLLLSLFLLSACGGGGDSPAPEGARIYAIYATVSGLNGSMVLQNMGTDDLTITQNGSSKFQLQLVPGSAYNITVKSSPAGQTCLIVGDNSGKVDKLVSRYDVNLVCTDIDTVAPVISLIGSTSVSVEVGAGYTDAGASAADDVDENITASIVVTNPVVFDVVGAYTVTYNVSDAEGNAATPVTRSVNVVDTTAPVITLLGTSSVTVEALSSYSDAGASAADNYDGDISNSITAVGDTINTGAVGTYTVTYNVSDAAGTAATTVTRTVIVEDTTAPVISLSGTSIVNLNLNESYSDAGATATDSLDGTISTITVGGDVVKTDIVGSYNITYNVSDAAGNPAVQVTRTVIVNLGTPVVAAYYTTAPNWNDYVKNDNTTQFDATNTPANGAETGGYSALIHGGEMRKVNLGITSCSDQAATDALGAFDWVCDDSTGSALMVSTGIKDSKNLSDLLDFTTPAWKTNSVTVTGTGADFTTAAAAWWSNPVTENNTGGSLATAGSIYLVTANPAAVYSVDASKIALIIKPGVTLFGPATSQDIIVTNTQNYLWFEGTIDVTGDNYGLLLSTVSFSVLRNLSTSNAVYDGINLNSNSVNNILSNITSSNNTGSSGGSGIEINGGSNNTLSNITAANNTNRGVQIWSSSDNILSDINVFNNGQIGFEIFSASNNNRVTNLRAVRQGWIGVNVQNSANNVLSNLTVSENGTGIQVGVATLLSNNRILNVTASNNWTYGLYINGVNTILSNITVTNTQSIGLFSGGLNNSLSNIAAVNNKSFGLRALNAGDNHHFSNIATVNNGNGFGFDGVSNNIFTGLLKVGGNAIVDCGDTLATSFSDASCTAVPPSDFTLISGVIAADSFVAKVTTDDSANTSDTNGTASTPADITLFDWFNFDNIFRAWGSDGLAFPSASNRDISGFAWASDTGRIWDWSLANSDTGDAGNPALQNVLTLPSNGNVANTIEHSWSGAAADQAACSALVSGSVFNAIDDCRSTYLRNASEIVGDNIGNDNGLCESGETCLFTPNIGAYQGHGALISAGTFTNGDTLTGITLMKYTTNGY